MKEVMDFYKLVKRDLTGMSEKELRDYFNDCMARGFIFVYSGGITNEPFAKEETLISWSQ